ncbi:MAG TPA: YbjN domain-containing protein [Allosphingosinicella sp.]|nr:YbjN domain-containing protein [Allosphingosinicella sp.]
MRFAIASILLAAGAGAATAQTTPAPARFNPASPENRQVLPTFNYATVETVLTQIGARFERRGTADRPILQVTFANGRRAAILYGSCERQGAACKAISIQAVWNRPAGATPERLGSAVQSFNQRYAFARAFLTADGRPALQRYLTADYGIIRGNLAVNLLVFATQVDRFVAEVLRPAPAAR